MAERCPEPQEGCRYAGRKTCMLTTHHLYWPRREYSTPVEEAFRELPENKERLSRCDHDELHRNEFPPIKPNLLQMLQALNKEQEYRDAA